MTLFIREKEELYRKYQELHLQKAYTLDMIKELVTWAGLEFVTAYDAYTMNPPHEESERICVVAREQGKERRKSEDK